MRNLVSSVIRWRSATLVGIAFLLCGCLAKQLPDPNDPKPGTVDPTVLLSDLKGVTDLLTTRRVKHEISEAEFKQRIVDGANALVERAQLTTVADDGAWKYAEVLRAAKQWEPAEKFYRQAVVYAKKVGSADRLVNDSLHLAQCLANEGRVDEAISMARSVFNVAPADAAPILIAVRLEIVPAAIGKGKDVELAHLLIDASLIRVRVDPSTPEGKAFRSARMYHLERAIDEAKVLFDKAGKQSEGEAALKAFAEKIAGT